MNNVMENVTMKETLTLNVEISVNTRIKRRTGEHVLKAVIKGKSCFCFITEISL